MQKLFPLAMIAYCLLSFSASHAAEAPDAILYHKNEYPIWNCLQKVQNLRVDGKAVIWNEKFVDLLQVAPDYPDSEAKKGDTACVFLLYDIDAKGRAENVSVMEAQPRVGSFAESAVRTLMARKFDTKKLEDRPLIYIYMTKK